MNLFDLTTRAVAEIAVFETIKQSNCYIAEKANKSVIYNGFILNDKNRVRTVCEVSFYPSSISGKYVPRLLFRKENKPSGEEKSTKRQYVRIEFSSSKDGYEQFWQMVGFLYQFKNLVDIEEFDKAYQVVSQDSYIVEFKTKKTADQVSDLSKLVEEANLDDECIVQVLNIKRAATLEIFKRLLFESGYWKGYENQNSSKMRGSGEEAVWHHFLKKNTWVLGLNLDIRFIRDLISEPDTGVGGTDNKGSAHADFLGINDYTVLVELKAPSTNIFTEKKHSTSKANTWSFSADFIDGVSQCLGQKFDWDKNHRQKQMVVNGKVLDQNLIRTVDPKTIFIVGNKSREFDERSKNIEILLKRDTFQRYRRDSRNVEMLTYDELYERAYYVVHGKNPKIKGETEDGVIPF